MLALVELLEWNDKSIPTCDICHTDADCGEDCCYTCANDWNGETGNHKSCESLRKTMENR